MRSSFEHTVSRIIVLDVQRHLKADQHAFTHRSAVTGSRRRSWRTRGPRFDSESKKLIVDEARQEHHQTDDQEEHRFYDQAKSQERCRRKRVAPRRRTSQGARRKRVAPRRLTLGDSRGAHRKRVAPRRRTLGASRIRRKRVAPCRLAVQARLRHPLEQKRVAPHCGEVRSELGTTQRVVRTIGLPRGRGARSRRSWAS